VSRQPRIPFYCWFCGKGEHQAAVLVVGPGNVGICDECVDQARDTVDGRKRVIALERDLARCACCRPAALLPELAA